jgi:hypothetical protein
MQVLKRALTLLMGLRRASSCHNGTSTARWDSEMFECRPSMEIETHRYCTAVEKSPLSSADDRFQNPKLASLLEVTVREGIKPDDLLNALEVSPELLDKSPIQWENCFKELKKHGFTETECLRMLTLYPNVVTLVESNEFKLCMAHWMNCELGYDNVLNLLAACPHFLSISRHELERRIPLLSSLGKSHGKNVTKLLKSCPSLLCGNWKDVEAKLDYVENVMKINTKKENLTKCYMFSRTLDEIQTRHIFLQRFVLYCTVTTDVESRVFLNLKKVMQCI